MVQHNQQCKNPECGWRDVIEVNPGEHPPCPVCNGETERLWLSGLSTFRDDIPGGITVENYGPHPITFYSHAERRRYMKAKGLTEIEKFCPMPGTDIDPQGIPNPAGYMDKQTMANATELICRNGVKSNVDPNATDGVFRDMQTGVITERDAIAISSGDPRRQSRLHRRQNSGR